MSYCPKRYFNFVGQVTVTWHSSDGWADDHCTDELYSHGTSRHLVSDKCWCHVTCPASQISWQPLSQWVKIDLNPGWETKFFLHSPELCSLLYSLYKIPLAQACFPLARPSFHLHWRALVCWHPSTDQLSWCRCTMPIPCIQYTLQC